MVSQERWAGPSTAGNSCPLPMTRAALLSLRASSALSINCAYQITDHVQGRLVAGTTITIHAVAANELSETAFVNTTYDNEAWSGRYDLDAGLVLELADNRNNRVIGSAAVSAFDWGNTAYSDCTVEHSTWVVTIGSTRPMQRVRLLDGSTLNTSGMTGGFMVNVEISKQSSVNVSNGNLAIQNSTITDQSTLTAAGYVAGRTGVLRSRIAEQASVSFGAGSGAVALQNSVVSSGASISHTGTGPLTFNGGTVTDNATIAHTGAGGLSATGCFVHGTATSIAHSDGGALTMTGSELGPYGRVLKNGASTGSLIINYCQIDTVGYVQQLGNGNISMTGTKIGQSGYVRTLAGSAVPAFTVNYSTVSETSSISMNATATAGNATINNCSLDSGGFIDKSGTGNLTVTGSKVTATGRIQLNGVRSLIVTGSLCSNVGRVVSAATAGAGVTDTFQNSSAQDYAIVQFSASGAAPNRVLYSSVRGLTGALTFSGTNTGTDVTRFTIDNGVVTFANNTVAFPTILDNAVRDGGTMAVSGCGAAQDIRYNTIQSGGRINLTNKTAAGPRVCHRNTVESLGTLTSQGAAGHVTENYVRQGVVNHNGGNLTSSSKTQGGTLTTGAFTHANIQHHAAVNKTLTANNTNRADYQGLAAQLV